MLDFVACISVCNNVTGENELYRFRESECIADAINNNTTPFQILKKKIYQFKKYWEKTKGCVNWYSIGFYTNNVSIFQIKFIDIERLDSIEGFKSSVCSGSCETDFCSYGLIDKQKNTRIEYINDCTIISEM